MDSSLRNLAVALEGPNEPDMATLRKGKVTAVSATSNPPTCTIQLSGDTSSTISGVRFMTGYWPVVDDIVVITKQQSQILILGRVADVYDNLYGTVTATSLGSNPPTVTMTIGGTSYAGVRFIGAFPPPAVSDVLPVIRDTDNVGFIALGRPATQADMNVYNKLIAQQNFGYVRIELASNVAAASGDLVAQGGWTTTHNTGTGLNVIANGVGGGGSSSFRRIQVTETGLYRIRYYGIIDSGGGSSSRAAIKVLLNGTTAVSNSIGSDAEAMGAEGTQMNIVIDQQITATSYIYWATYGDGNNNILTNHFGGCKTHIIVERIA